MICDFKYVMSVKCALRLRFWSVSVNLPCAPGESVPPAVPGFGAHPARRAAVPATPWRLPCPHGLAALFVLTSTKRPALTFPTTCSDPSVSLRGVDVFWSRVSGRQRPGKSPAVLAAAASLLRCFSLVPARLTATRSRASFLFPAARRAGLH